MKRLSSARHLLAGCLILASAGAVAQERPLYESLEGWQVERATSASGNNQCVIVRNYVDEDDEDTDRSVAFALENKALVLVLTLSTWTFDKDEKFVATTDLDDKSVASKVSFTGNGTRAVATLPASILDKAADAEEISVKGKGWKATFDLFGVSDAIEGLKRCNAGEPPTPRS